MARLNSSVRRSLHRGKEVCSQPRRAVPARQGSCAARTSPMQGAAAEVDGSNGDLVFWVPTAEVRPRSESVPPLPNWRMQLTARASLRRDWPSVTQEVGLVSSRLRAAVDARVR